MNMKSCPTRATGRSRRLDSAGGRDCMRLLARLMVTLLVATVAWGQTTPIKGIKIKESGFDPATHMVKLVFINDTPLDITAWAYCVHAENSPAIKDEPAHGFCTMLDTSGPVVEHQIAHSNRPWLGEVDCTGCTVVHPGQTLTLENKLPSPVIKASIEVNAVVFSDGTWSADTEKGRQDVNALALGRHYSLQIVRKALEIGTKILNDAADGNPAMTMLAELKRKSHLAGIPNAQASDDGILVRFQKPEWRVGNDRDFIPQDQKAYLGQFLDEQRVWEAFLSQHQIREAGVQQ
jgi:hypothetical protein